MKYILVLVIGLLGAGAGYCQEDQAERSARQAELDRKCEDARQTALAPLKRELYRECMEKRGDGSVCRDQADAYDGARANRGPMFYDLPECEQAFNYRKGNSGRE